MSKMLMLVSTLLVSAAWLISRNDRNPVPGGASLRILTLHLTREEARRNDRGSLDFVRLPDAKPRAHKHAEAKIAVRSSEATPFDQIQGPTLTEVHITETFTGEIDGESTVRALQVRRDDHSASLVSLQRFRGKLDGRQGTFVLQGSETVENGAIKAKWFVVPGSGTGELSGLRGNGGFEGAFGKGSNGTLDYWFE